MANNVLNAADLQLNAKWQVNELELDNDH